MDIDRVGDGLRRRVGRARRRLLALERDASWYLGGGKRFFERHYAEMASAYRWCFVVGCNNSGTSLLQSILTRTGSVSKMNGEGQLHTAVLARAHRPAHPGVWSEFISDLQVEPAESERLGPRLAHDWLAAHADPHMSLLLEKSTVNTVRMPFLARVFPNSFFVGLVRDGYAVSEGIRRKTGSSLPRCARHWNLVNEIMVENSTRVPRYLEVRYEDLSAHPEEVGHGLTEFLGLDRNAVFGALAANYTRSTIEGAGERAVGNMNPASWARLSAEDVKAIETEAGEMLCHFGYPRPP